ncbi:unnamed protein product [Ectocarpus sp. 4 AP-2014]
MPSTDREALVALYNATGGACWRRNVNWDTDANLSTWHGVQVNDQGRVVKLSLTNNNLTGFIPKKLGALSELKVLRFGNKALGGPIPPELGGLIALNEVSLNANQLSGHIPPELGNLANLGWLFLRENDNTSGNNAEEPGPLPGWLRRFGALIHSISFPWPSIRRVPQHGSCSFYMHRAARLADREGSVNRMGSTKRSYTMLGVLAATVLMPGVAAVETYGGITDFVTSARERWCNMHVALHVVATILTGICLFKSVIFAIGEIKAGWAELSEALHDARQAKHAAARTQSRTAPRGRLQSVKYMN